MSNFITGSIFGFSILTMIPIALLAFAIPIFLEEHFDNKLWLLLYLITIPSFFGIVMMVYG